MPERRWCECGEYIATKDRFMLAKHDWIHLQKCGHPDIPPSDDPGRVVITMRAAAYIQQLEAANRSLLFRLEQLEDRVDE